MKALPFDTDVIRLYPEFGVPADRLLTEPDTGLQFVSALKGRFPGELPPSEDVLKRVLTLRKLGLLPRLGRSYHGRNMH